eukprot:9031876-Pyramimonas_sp.AAC.1
MHGSLCGPPTSALCHAVQASSLPGRFASFSVSRELLSGFWAQRGVSLLPLEAHLGPRSDPGRWTTV